MHDGMRACGEQTHHVASRALQVCDGQHSGGPGGPAGASPCTGARPSDSRRLAAALRHGQAQPLCSCATVRGGVGSAAGLLRALHAGMTRSGRVGPWSPVR